MKWEPTAFSAAAAGTTTPGTAGRRTATTTPRITATTTTVSDWFPRARKGWMSADEQSVRLPFTGKINDGTG